MLGRSKRARGHRDALREPGGCIVRAEEGVSVKRTSRWSKL